MSSSGNYVVNMYPHNNDYIGEITIDDAGSAGGNIVDYQTVIVLDRSGSMGNQVERIVNVILPKMFDKLGYRAQNIINLVTFESRSETFTEARKKFPTLNIKSEGATCMMPAVKLLEEIFDELDSNRPVRLLVISDGEIHDPLETKQAADELSQSLVEKGFFINSKAVRFFTSSSQPDTTALCCLLQVNNALPQSLVDINSALSDEEIATKMAELFLNDSFEQSKVLTASDSILCLEPWNQPASNVAKILLLPGQNIFYMIDVPTNGLKVSGVKVKISTKAPLTQKQYQALMGTKFPLIEEKMKILKAVDSTESRKVVLRMNNHFMETQKVLLARSTNEDNDLSSNVSTKLNVIANDNSVANMDSAAKALYIAPKK